MVDIIMINVETQIELQQRNFTDVELQKKSKKQKEIQILMRYTDRVTSFQKLQTQK